MKLRYLYLAIGVLCNASLVSCGDSFKEKTEIVACGISTNALTFGVSSTEVQTVDITSEAAWEVAVDQAGGNWLTVSPLEGTGNMTSGWKAIWQGSCSMNLIIWTEKCSLIICLHYANR